MNFQVNSSTLNLTRVLYAFLALLVKETGVCLKARAQKNYSTADAERIMQQIDAFYSAFQSFLRLWGDFLTFNEILEEVPPIVILLEALVCILVFALRVWSELRPLSGDSQGLRVVSLLVCAVACVVHCISASSSLGLLKYGHEVLQKVVYGEHCRSFGQPRPLATQMRRLCHAWQLKVSFTKKILSFLKRGWFTRK